MNRNLILFILTMVLAAGGAKTLAQEHDDNFDAFGDDDGVGIETTDDGSWGSDDEFETEGVGLNDYGYGDDDDGLLSNDWGYESGEGGSYGYDYDTDDAWFDGWFDD